MKLELLVCGVLLVGGSQAANWALLVAGSNSWMNYRHQADICHAYQILKERGFPEDKIVTLMYDDIANNQENPLPGQIINQPGGKDVYKGVKIDYKGNDVTSQNFLNILSGNTAAMNGIGTGRVIESGPDDNVFVNFADHGGVGLLAFPNDLLYADDLEKTLRQIAENKQFKKLLFYVEACEAGSMFDGILEEHNNILVSTASARDESSFGWYCDNPTIDTCLGDLYSISWMQHMDQLSGDSANEETLFHQYDVVRTAVNESHVNFYGDFRVGYDTVDAYFGKSSKQAPSRLDRRQFTKFDTNTAGVPSRDIPIFTAKQQLHRAPPHKKLEKARQLTQIFTKRAVGDATVHSVLKRALRQRPEMMDVVAKARFPLSKDNFPCYKQLLQEFNRTCFDLAKNNYLLKHVYKLANLCSLSWITEAQVTSAMQEVCTSQHRSIDQMI